MEARRGGSRGDVCIEKIISASCGTKLPFYSAASVSIYQ